MTFTDLTLRLRALFRHRHIERDLREEFDFHHEMAARSGRSPGAETDLWMEQCRDARGIGPFEDLVRDLRFALRRLRRAPVFTLVAVATLALGIGANTALFSLVDAVMLRRLPVPHPAQLVLLGNPTFDGMESGTTDHNVDGLTYSQYQQLRDQNQVFGGLAAFSAFQPTFRATWGADSDDSVPLKFVSANYFQVLELAPAAGRFFSAAETSPAARPEAILSFDYWQRNFAASPAVIGRTVRLSAAVFTVIGVAPRGFHGTTVGQAPAIFIPLSLQRSVYPTSDWLHDPPGITRRLWLLAIGRLRPNVSLSQARAAVGVIFSQSIRVQAALAPDAATRADLLTQFVPVSTAATGASAVSASFGHPLLLLQALVALVLLIVVLNLGAMMLEQASGRQREFAMRLALGASRRRLVRQMLTESLLLASVGGLLGWWLALWGERLLVGMVAAGDSGFALPLGFDPSVLAFTAAICLVAGVAFGLAPALRLSRPGLAQRVAARGIRTPRTGTVLVVAQIALAIVLVTGAALLVRSLAQLRGVPLGYSALNLDTFHLNVDSASATPAQALDAYQRVTDALLHLPGISVATFSDNGLFTGRDSGDSMIVPGYARGDAGSAMDWVAPGYFAALGIPIRRGRGFAPTDRGLAVAPMVIDELFAQKYFAGRDPLGQLVTVKFTQGNQAFQVVGVSAKALQHDVRDDAKYPRLYLDFFNGHFNGVPAANFLVRVAPGATLARAQVNALVERVSGMPMKFDSLGSLSASLDATVAPDLLLANLAAFFGLLALGLAAMGLYAMLSYAVVRRRAEIAIRMALGARASQVTAMVVRQALLLIVTGIALGTLAALAAGRGLASLLYQLKPTDPFSLAAAAGLLLLCGLTAALIPALRASRTDPVRTLRADG